MYAAIGISKFTISIIFSWRTRLASTAALSSINTDHIAFKGIPRALEVFYIVV